MKRSRNHSGKQSAADRRKWRLFKQAVDGARAAFADVPPDELQKMIDEAVEDARAERRAKLIAGRARKQGQSGRPRLRKKRGTWTLATGKPMVSDETAQALRNVRAKRNRQNAGKGRRK